jgi:hypothetical protein
MPAGQPFVAFVTRRSCVGRTRSPMPAFAKEARRILAYFGGFNALPLSAGDLEAEERNHLSRGSFEGASV